MFRHIDEKVDDEDLHGLSHKSLAILKKTAQLPSSTSMTSEEIEPLLDAPSTADSRARELRDQYTEDMRLHHLLDTQERKVEARMHDLIRCAETGASVRALGGASRRSQSRSIPIMSQLLDRLKKNSLSPRNASFSDTLFSPPAPAPTASLLYDFIRIPPSIPESKAASALALASAAPASTSTSASPTRSSSASSSSATPSPAPAPAWRPLVRHWRAMMEQLGRQDKENKDNNPAITKSRIRITPVSIPVALPSASTAPAPTPAPSSTSALTPALPTQSQPSNQKKLSPLSPAEQEEALRSRSLRLRVERLEQQYQAVCGFVKKSIGECTERMHAVEADAARRMRDAYERMADADARMQDACERMQEAHEQYKIADDRARQAHARAQAATATATDAEVNACARVKIACDVIKRAEIGARRANQRLHNAEQRVRWARACQLAEMAKLRALRCRVASAAEETQAEVRRLEGACLGAEEQAKERFAAAKGRSVEEAKCGGPRDPVWRESGGRSHVPSESRAASRKE